MKKHNYIGINDYRMLIVYARISFLLKAMILLFIIKSLPEPLVMSQNIPNDQKADTSLVYDEIPVYVMVEGYGNFYMDVLYSNTGLLYINVEDLFKTLKIPYEVLQKGDSNDGIIENKNRTYFIDFNKRQIKVGDKLINSKSGMVTESGTLFLESSIFPEAFGLTLTFNFRALTIILKSDFELPVVKQFRLEKMRNNISKLKGELIADTTVKRNYHLFMPGMMDWSVLSSQTWKGSGNNRIGLGVGSELLYGEAEVSVYYSDKYKFDNRQLHYLWRWVDNEKPIIKQAQVGKISNQTISFINSPVIGASVRNSPTTVRKAKGYYIINENTEPNWTVELYINNVMVDFTTADASGLFIFKVPIVYGYTTLKLKFYGPMGEERTEERTMNMPYSIMPAKELEYGISAGILQDGSSSRFGKGDFNYGVNNYLTVGGGFEYLSSIPNGALIPFAKVTIQPLSKLTFNGEYAYGVRTRGMLNYYFMKSALLEIDYTKYVEGQLATYFRYLEDRKVRLTFPVRYKKIIGFAKINFTQLVYKTFNYNQGSIMLSAYYKQFSANSTTQRNWIDHMKAYLTTDLSMSYRIRNGFTLRPSARYNVSKGEFMTCKVQVEKRIPKGYISGSYQWNIIYNASFINLSYKYDLPFARTSISAVHSKAGVSTFESASGSLAFGSGNKYVYASKNSSLGKGGISLYPFLDMNQNGVFDKGEHMVKLNTVRIMGGKVILSEKDSIIRIPDLNVFINYNLEFSDNDLENVSWRFKNKIYSVLVDPNQFKRIDIPIIPVGEVSGMVYMNTDNSLKGIGRITVKFYNKNGDKVIAETLSESDGYIYYLGLPPGEYIARVDSSQLNNLGFRAEPTEKLFTIEGLEDGDSVGGIEFVLSR